MLQNKQAFFLCKNAFGKFSELKKTFFQKSRQRFDFLTNKNLAFGATIAVDVWMWTPFMILMTLAALGSVPKAELEAAEIDQIPWLKRIWYIILPNGKFILMLGILLRTIDAFKTTDLVLLMTNGGPNGATEVVMTLLYKLGLEQGKLGVGSAGAVLLFLATLVLTLVVQLITRRKKDA